MPIRNASSRCSCVSCTRAGYTRSALGLRHVGLPAHTTGRAATAQPRRAVHIRSSSRKTQRRRASDKHAAPGCSRLTSSICEIGRSTAWTCQHHPLATSDRPASAR
ncbi:hypothetical protein PLICRDRAFT_93856 [Plicaturopsis crispa FD-325 SS-3]|nr:hypothetical protein PLICRDRAFT_93856 [Plicaturopsis crispa FD-325 SS-3]